MSTRPAQSNDSWRATRPDAENAPDWRSGPFRPLVGITADLAEAPAAHHSAAAPAPAAPRPPRAVASMTYIKAVTDAGGIPVLLPPIPELAHEFARRFDAFVFTGGDDPRTEPFGEPTHPSATLVHPQRQAFEVALLNELLHRPAAPVLGVCLGMQMMALHAGGKLNQHMPDDTPTADQHRPEKLHEVRPQTPPQIFPQTQPSTSDAAAHPLIVPGMVTSHHRQAVRDPGRLRVVAVAPDGIIEAIDDPSRPFYLGVQWHPERTAFEPLGVRLFKRLIQAVRP